MMRLYFLSRVVAMADRRRMAVDVMSREVKIAAGFCAMDVLINT
jgi:hypothetical protein